VEPKLAYRIIGGVAGLGLLMIVLSMFSFGGTSKVTGRVTFGGRPVIWGSVVLVGPDGRSAAGRIEPDGTYTVANAPRGEVLVSVSSPDPLYQHYATQLKTSREQGPQAQWAALPVDRKQWFALPKRFEDPNASGVTLTVKRGNNPLDIALTP
jgi:hypothetical protein